jgi:signal transduction histidine kinase
MRNLTLSLILVVVTAVIGLGWLITEIRYRNSIGDAGLSDELVAYQQFGKELALVLDDTADKESFIARWQAQTVFAIRLQDRANLPVPEELRTDFASSGLLILESDNNISMHFLLPKSNQVLSLVVPDDSASSARSANSLILTLAFYACVIAILLLWLYPLLRRLMGLSSMAQDFGRGNLSSRIAPSSFSYIGGIELEVNRMADRIQTLINDNKLLSRAVSHNLKTPLARLRFGIDTLEETIDPELRKKYNDRINKDLLEMESLVETLLQYAKLNESRVQLHIQKIELNEFVRQLFANITHPTVKILYYLADPDTTIEVDPNYLAMQLNNVVDNALKHAHGIVGVTVTTKPGEVTLIIEDDGEGIPVLDRNEVIKPFWRGKQGLEAKGHGMGLAIVARIAEWFGADLIIDKSEVLGGAAIWLRFPRLHVLGGARNRSSKSVGVRLP